MPDAGFFRAASHAPHAQTVFDACTGSWLTFAQFSERVESFAAHLRFPRKALGFHFPWNDSPSLIAYVAAIEAGHAVVMLDPELDPEWKMKLIERFHPEFIIAPASHAPDPAVVGGGGYTACEPQEGQVLLCAVSRHRYPIHPDLTLLISTSGSTGSPKLVRLSRRNLESNARQINDVVKNGDADRYMVSSPIFNGLGQSVIHSALLAGGSLVLSRSRIVSREYWDTVRDTKCNAIAGAPYFYQVLERLDLDSLNVPHLAKFVQSAGRLPEHLVRKFHFAARHRGGALHLMYGQAEGTARLTGLPPEWLPEACRSVGVALPGGRMWIERDGLECEPMEEGELIYEGPNVMMGYATCPEDLAEAGNPGERLATGDLGYRDERGLFYITGRKSRFVKLNGWRVSLDDIEELLSDRCSVAAVNEADRIIIYGEETNGTLEAAVYGLAERMRLHPSSFTVRGVDSLPRLANGKVDYRALVACRHAAPPVEVMPAYSAGAQ
jgi:acyl-CoA synthetase (AMP-forming)/AMP-acid ligase II